MSAAALLLDRLGRPGDVRLGTARPAAVPRLSTGVPQLDAALDGGLPRGRLTELAGARSSGRTGLACVIAAAATRAGETIAWVDPENGLEPEAVADAGVVLAHTLWVRPRGERDALRAAELLLGAGGFGLVVLDLGSLETAERGAPWPRLVHAAERTGAALLVVAARRLAGACAALGLELQARRVCWSGEPGRLALLMGIDARLTIARSRVGRMGQALVVRQACA
jgi:RecA/RadA recombinase